MRLVVFDLDHTLLTVNSSFHFGSFLYRQNFFSFLTLVNCLWGYTRHKWLGMSINDLHYKLFSNLFEGRVFADVHRHVDQFLTESLSNMLYEPVVQRLRKAQSQGDYVLILSSAPDFLVKEIAHRLKVHDWKATVYQCDAEGKMSAVTQVIEGKDKAHYVKVLADQLNLSRSAITVYSDSYLDLPILKIAGQAIGVGPDYRLKRICLQNGWEIL